MSELRLFDEGYRLDEGFASFSESEFSYLNRSARPEYARLRDLLEQWFVKFPAPDKTDLWARFRSDNDNQQAGAFFELYCHALVSSQGFSGNVHAVADQNRNTTPDFTFVRDDAATFFLETPPSAP